MVFAGQRIKSIARKSETYDIIECNLKNPYISDNWFAKLNVHPYPQLNGIVRLVGGWKIE